MSALCFCEKKKDNPFCVHEVVLCFVTKVMKHFKPENFLITYRLKNCWLYQRRCNWTLPVYVSVSSQNTPGGLFMRLLHQEATLPPTPTFSTFFLLFSPGSYFDTLHSKQDVLLCVSRLFALTQHRLPQV